MFEPAKLVKTSLWRREVASWKVFVVAILSSRKQPAFLYQEYVNSIS